VIAGAVSYMLLCWEGVAHLRIHYSFVTPPPTFLPGATKVVIKELRITHS